MAGTESSAPSSLVSFLDSAELETISSSLREKLELTLNSKDTELENIKAEHEKLRVNSGLK